MKAIHNKTHEPLRVPLRADSVLHLGPGQRAHISDDALQSPAVRRLIDSGAISVEGEERRAGAIGERHDGPKEFAHGHVHGNKVFPSGNRGG